MPETTHTVTIRGHSDDILCIEGGLHEELYPSESACELNLGDILGLSDGSTVRVIHDQEGVWRLTVLCCGEGTKVTKTDGTEDSGSDVVILTAVQPYRWAVLGKYGGYVKARVS